jgi:PadR family transcriptional regulator PadR
LTNRDIEVTYVVMKHMGAQAVDRELKKGSAELLILSLIEHRARHGYEISKLIEERSGGVLKFNVASFYPLLYRLEERGLIAGRWVEKAGQRRRRYYRLTAQGKETLKAQRSTWLDFVNAIHRITEAENA